MTVNIKRHFVTLDGRWGRRQVHYRRAGDGPLLLLLHQSPQSSRELEPLMAEWGRDFTVVAPDTPGYGLSAPLGVEQAELSEFADATIEFLDAIGARRFGVYGFHTGGMIGVALAHGYPDRVTCFACNGIAVLDDAERADILANYLPPFEPRWDGGHLTWLWGRTRYQTIFFPWYRSAPADRMDYTMPPPEALQAGVREFLRAGDHYRVGYRAAFTFDSAAVVAQLSVPGVLTASGFDPLQAHLARLDKCPEVVSIEKIASPDEIKARCLERLRQYPGDSITTAPATLPVDGRLWRQMVPGAHAARDISLLRGGAGSGRPVIVLHGPGASAAVLSACLEDMAATRSVVAIDLPGHGETDAGPDAVTLQRCADTVIAVLDSLDIRSADVVAVEGGACVATELAARAADRIAQLAIVHPPVLSGAERSAWLRNGLPSFAPDWAGGHLLACWHKVRDGRLYFPWFERTREAILWQAPMLDDEGIQREVTELLKAEGVWQPLFKEQLDYSLEQALQDRPDTFVLGAVNHPWHAAARNLAGRCQLPFHELSETQEGWGEQIAAALLSDRSGH